MVCSNAILEQYWGVIKSAGLIDCKSQGKVRVTGPDRVSFLHAMISNDVQELALNAGRYATLLTAQGRIVADFYCYKLFDSVLIDVHQSLLSKLVSVLDKFIIMDDVTLRDDSRQWRHLSLQGPRAEEFLNQVMEADAPREELQLKPLEWAGAQCLVVRKGFLHPEGIDILLPAEAAHHLKGRLKEELSILEVEAEAANLLRLERGIPLYGTDMDESNYPMEARLHSAISLTKGCFIGQEVVAKATHVGGVNRLLCRLQLLEDRVPQPDASVSVEGKKVGTITSAARSPRVPHPIALGYLRRACSAPGQRVEIECPEGATLAAEVVETFQVQ